MTKTASSTTAMADATSPNMRIVIMIAMVAAVLSGCRHTGALSETIPLSPLWSHPPRPRLPEPADTNDAKAYALIASIWISSNPDSAAAAFYWASRLSPWLAEPYYGRAIALLLTTGERDERFRERVWLPKRRLRLDEVRILDSLHRLAVERDPFLKRQYDYLMTGRLPDARRRRVRDAATRGFWALQAGSYEEAVEHLGRALAKRPKQVLLRAYRAQALYHLHRYDSAAHELGVLIDSLTAREAKELSPIYLSKALLYYAQGLAYVEDEDSSAARVAFEQAVTEDLAFYMAHVRLGELAARRRDTATLVREIGEALTVKEDDPALRLYLGYVLHSLGRSSEAEAQLRQAIAANPDYALPYYHLGIVLSDRADTAAAIGAYDAFLARAPRADPVREDATVRRQVLGGGKE